MKKVLILGLLVFVGVAGWRVGESLSSDATGMAVGILLGVMAGIPTALIVLASGRRSAHYTQGASSRHAPRQLPQQMYQPQPPVIVVTGNGGQQQLPQGQAALHGFAEDPYGAHPPQRNFTVVGGEELDEDW